MPTMPTWGTRLVISLVACLTHVSANSAPLAETAFSNPSLRVAALVAHSHSECSRLLEPLQKLGDLTFSLLPDAVRTLSVPVLNQVARSTSSRALNSA